MNVSISSVAVSYTHLGDGASDALIAPQWTQKKTIVLNEIDKLMAREKTWQGKRAAHG